MQQISPLLPQSLGELSQANATPLLRPQQTDQVNFSALFNQAINHVNGLQQISSGLATRIELGDTSITLSDTVIAREKASVAFEASLQVRNKLVEAYKEIMAMPV